MSNWGWNQNQASGGWYSGTSIANITTYPYFIQPQPLVPVLESPSAPLSDREWLDAQVVEVCELAAA